VLVEGARRLAENAGISSSFTKQTNGLAQQGTFDIILSLDCFEHYLIPLECWSKCARLRSQQAWYWSLSPRRGFTRMVDTREKSLRYLGST
jgi:2-polyprenyl-3-methyl-5-hydroxy-6-metoxy-1,4-benzoquinol methylase